MPCDDHDGLGLPPLFPLAGFEGSLSEYVERLYWEYRAIVSDAGITLWGKPLVGRDQETADGRNRLFWHLITDSHPGAARTLSLKRAASLGRAWWLLERLGEGDSRVVWWREQDGRVIVAPVDFSYLVALLERPRVYVLRSAYPVNHPEVVRQRARWAWVSDLMADVADGELYCRARRHRPPSRVRIRPDLVRTPAAVERVRCWM